MAAFGNTDVEAAKLPGSSSALKSPWGSIKQIASPWAASRSQPPGAAGRANLSSPPEYGLMKRTSELRHAVEIGNAILAAEVIDRLNLQKSAGFTVQDVSGNGLLQIAALKNNVEMTRVLLRKGFDINAVDSNHGTALQAAIYMDHMKVIDVLLDRSEKWSADVNTPGGYYGCALQVASFKGSASLISRLLEAQADVSVCGGKYGSVLQAAVRTGLLSILLLILKDRVLDVNKEGGVYGTALQAAAKGNYTLSTTYLRRLSRGRVLRHETHVPRTTSTETVDYLAVASELISRGAIVKSGEGRLGNPVNAAASSGRLDMLELLVSHDTSTPEQRKRGYSTALISAITQTFNTDRLPLVELLVGHGADVNFESGSGLYSRPLTAAAAMDCVEVMSYLLSAASDKVAIMNAESGIYGSALRAALSANAQKTARYLIEQGADVSTRGDSSFGNVLHLAAFSNMDKVVQLLLNRGVDVNLRDDSGQSALHIAAYRGYKAVVSILLKKGAKVELKDVWGDTPGKIVEDVIERESHPGPSLEDLRKIKQQLFEASVKENSRKPGDLIHGPPIVKKPQAIAPEYGEAKPVYSSPMWNPGLSFNATIIDFLQKDGDEYFLVKSSSMDDMLYRKDAVPELMSVKEPGYTKNLRWYHIPSNNMIWAQMLMKILWTQKYPKTACKSFWGTDPYYVSPDLAPHARFVTPQCERLCHDILQQPDPQPKDIQRPQNTLFLAMPYLHWESYRSAEAVSDLLDDIKEDSLKTRILRSGKTWRTHEANPKPLFEPAKAQESYPTKNAKVRDDDDELLRRYLFKRWPLHLRRTLDQYYYSYLADTRTRDGDQVVMRVRNEELQKNESAVTGMYHWDEAQPNGAKSDSSGSKSRWKSIWKGQGKEKEQSVHTLQDEPHDGRIPRDKNSPIVMVDQLWLWTIDTDTIITCFPHRRTNREDGDLDTDDKTDVLETLLHYLRSAKRHPIQNAYDLSELIISQCVGILHRSDTVPDLDFLNIFGSQANRRVDEVMERLTKFVQDFKDFMAFIKDLGRISDEYIKRFEKIFSVTDETLLLREIQDMKDELNMLAAVFSDQHAVLEKAGIEIAEDRKKRAQTRSSAFNFKQQSEKHSRHVMRMSVQASQAYDTLKDLLDLKQQQANVLEARVSRNQAMAAKEQGKTIMVFTIVTIIFLPLTFMTTVFTLPIIDFERWDPSDPLVPKADGLLKGDYVFRLIVAVTFALAVPLVLAAFQIKRLQRWWEEAQGALQIRKWEARDRAKKEGTD